MIGVAKFAFQAYGLTSRAVHTLTHPVQAVQDSIRGLLVKIITKAVMAIAGDAAASMLKERFQTEKSVDLRVNIPNKLRGVVLDADALKFTEQLANDALSAPLALLGLSLGALSLTCDPNEPVLCVTGTFKLAPPEK